jgi:IclR family mhp operon transcriptional activator
VLSVIEVLNKRTVTSVDVIHRVTGIPKPTLIRILGTLVGAGYVFHVSRRDGYALAEKILRLSAGFHYHDAIVDIARPLFDAFTRKHKWQLTLATPDTYAMLIRYNTRHLSPFAPDRRYLNQRLHMLASSVGRAYIAYCTDIERDTIMRFVQAPDAVRLAQLAKMGEINVEALIEATRHRRYATIERPPDNHVRSFGIPVLSAESGSAIASMAVSYFASAMTEAQATGRYLDEMYEIAERIAAGVSAMHEDFTDPIPMASPGAR